MTAAHATPLAPALPDFAAVEDAAKRIAGLAVVTPLLEAPLLNATLGCRLLVKAEPLQRTGSFKFRGAYNRISRLTADERKRGVVAFSSGNHAQGVAAAAQLVGTPAVIVMPSDAPAIKVANTRAYGAEVVAYDRWRESREEIGARLTAERGAVLVPPYDDVHVIAGQGTVGLEVAQQAAAQGITLDAVLACASGGGLIAGIALAMERLSPRTEVFVCEPAGFDDHARSLAGGSRVANAPGASSICDALLATTPGDITFPINNRLLRGGLVASDDEVLRAMAVAFRDLKLVVEPGGAVGLAAVLAGKLPVRGRTIAVVCSGGNVDPATYGRALAML
ncbi:MAG: threonine/serine dehydratase [Alphaproteobacteria bacterium]|nr:threonine/serine dehydratase [Alphaproteobacteria bacterium]